jgi:hypothetical protein
VVNSPSTPNSASKRWQKIADQRAIEVADLRRALQWCVDHDGECLGDHPTALGRAKAALAAQSTQSETGDTAHLVERIHQFDAAIRRIADRVGAVCGGIDTEGDGPGGSTAAEIVRKIDEITVKRDALHLVVSLLAGKLTVENETLIGMLNQAEEELRAKRWLS